MISPFFLIFQLYSDVKIFNNAKNRTNTADIMIESNINKIKRNTPTLSNFNILKKSLPISIFVYSHMIMSYLEAPRISFVKNLNITNFFNQYSRIYTDYLVD